MLSSSQNQADMIRAKNTGLVKDFITKPLRTSHLEKIFLENGWLNE